MGNLTDKVAIVMGAGHGIGTAYAHGLAAEGAKVVIAEIDETAAANVALSIEATGGTALAVKTDISNQHNIASMVGLVVEQLGTVDILVNNAAIFSTVPMSRLPFDQIPMPEWDAMMAVNVRGSWLASRAVASIMKTQHHGKIINISSSTALSGSPSRIHYVTSKAAILGFTKTLARELGPFNICVNCVAPGNTLSEVSPDEATLAFRHEAANRRSLKRVERPEDLVGAVVFFASSDSDFITGQTLVVDGGGTMR